MMIHLLSSLHPQYGGQKAIDTHRYKLLQLLHNSSIGSAFDFHLSSTDISPGKVENVFEFKLNQQLISGVYPYLQIAQLSHGLPIAS